MNTLPNSNASLHYALPHFHCFLQLPDSCFLPIHKPFISGNLPTLSKSIGVYPQKAKLRRNYPSTIASASTSTSISGEINLEISTMLVAGRIAAKNSPCARPTFSQSPMFVTKIRVRTTSFSPAPALPSAASIFRIVCPVSAYTSPTPTIFPSGPVAVVPDTLTQLPILTAREYPTIGSHCVPLEMFCRDTSISFAALASRKRVLNLLDCGTPRLCPVTPACPQSLTPSRLGSAGLLRAARGDAKSTPAGGFPRAGKLYQSERRQQSKILS